jgi:hypothetical protein
MNKHEYVMKLVNKPTAWIGHGVFAMDLVEVLKPEIVVDLGVDYGFSTFCFAYHNIGKVFGIDWFQGDEQAGFRNTLADVVGMYDQLKIAHGISNVEFIQSDFTEASKTWEYNIDILHIDGLHTYEAIKNDFESWIEYLTPDGVVLFHDVESYPHSVGVFFNEIKDGHKIIRSGSAGLGIFTRSEKTMRKIQKIL